MKSNKLLLFETLLVVLYVLGGITSYLYILHSLKEVYLQVPLLPEGLAILF